MKKNKLYLLSAVALMSVSSVYAQNAEDIYRISFTNRSSGTARSAAMGGAFTSLGADPSSVHINPAGIGMYRSSEVSFTPSLHASSVRSLSDINNLSIKRNKGSLIINNFSAIFNIFNDNNSALKGFTLGLSYNRDNYTKFISESKSADSKVPIGDYFSAQLYGIKEDVIKSLDSDPFGVYRNTPSGLWGAMMAYNNFLIDPRVVDGITDYAVNPDYLPSTDLVAPSQKITQKNNTDNFSISAGFNIGDMLYLGTSIGARMYDYHKESSYRETDVRGNTGGFTQLDYKQYNNVTGTAFDFKVGATLEPINGLKIGIAMHAPTISFMKDEYYADMHNFYRETPNSTLISEYNAETPYDPIEYKVKSAPKLLGGISYRLPFMILSFDYERAWYNKMDVRGMNGGEDILNSEIANTYKPTDSYMGGVEVQPMPGFFVRGGYAYYGSALKNEESKYGTTQNISFGLGIKREFYYIDLTYINSAYSTLPYKYYGGYFDGPAEQEQFVGSESIISQKFNNSTVSLTVGFRF